MTDWTDASSVETGWAEKTQSQTSTVLYNDVNIKYNLDYITYDGYYVLDETDWAGVTQVETAWAE